MKTEEIKTFVIDTNVLIHRPDAIMSFKDNEIVIPLWVLEELDKLKGSSDEKGRNARHAIRFLDEAGKHGDLTKGVKLENGSVLSIFHTMHMTMPRELDKEKVDNKILLSALNLQKDGKRVFFVSKDINARVKALALGIKAVDYEKQKVNFRELYAGFKEVNISDDALREIEEKFETEVQDILLPNQFAVLKAGKGRQEILSRYDPEIKKVKKIDFTGNPVSGIKPLNLRQEMALNLLLDDSIALVSLIGIAGTGKTLLAIAAGLKKVLEDRSYSRLLISRPLIPMGRDIGYLPGSKEEKLSNWMQPVFDNLEYILSVYNRQNAKNVEQLMANKLIEIEALTYIRGRSLPGQYIIVDEAQNLTPHEIKTIVSRAGQNSKVVLTGDPYQIDSPYLDSNSNGLTYLVDAFKGQKLFGHVTLEKSERSRLAELAAQLL